MRLLVSCKVLMPSYETRKQEKVNKRVSERRVIVQLLWTKNQPEGANGLRISSACQLAACEGRLARQPCKARKEINEGGMVREEKKRRKKYERKTRKKTRSEAFCWLRAKLSSLFLLSFPCKLQHTLSTFFSCDSNQEHRKVVQGASTLLVRCTFTPLSSPLAHPSQPHRCLKGSCSLLFRNQFVHLFWRDGDVFWRTLPWILATLLSDWGLLVYQIQSIVGKTKEQPQGKSEEEIHGVRLFGHFIRAHCPHWICLNLFKEEEEALKVIKGEDSRPVSFSPLFSSSSSSSTLLTSPLLTPSSLVASKSIPLHQTRPTPSNHEGKEEHSHTSLSIQISNQSLWPFCAYVSVSTRSFFDKIDPSFSVHLVFLFIQQHKKYNK